MPTLFAQVVIPHKDLLPADSVVNTFNFTGVDDREAMCTAILGRLVTFYSGTVTGFQKVYQYMSSELNFTGARLKIYDEADAEPRVPIFNESMGLAAPSTLGVGNLPGEVALCASYRGIPESGANPRRTRGRIYIGPLGLSASEGAANIACRPATAFISTLRGATLKLAEDSTLGAAWVVWSRKAGSAVVIHQGYVDNAFDTQRRRGVNATTRNAWEVETDPA